MICKKKFNIRPILTLDNDQTQLNDDKFLRGEGHRKRLRERFLQVGINGFSDHEFVELLLMICMPRRDVKVLAKKLLQRFKTITNLVHASQEELQQFTTGELLYVTLKLVGTIHEIMLSEQQKHEKSNSHCKVICLIKMWQSKIGFLNFEVLEIALLDSNYNVPKNGIIRLENGVVNQTNISIRKIFELLLRQNSYGFILAHNHPTGNCIPSKQDIYITNKLSQLSQDLGIKFLDHIIIAKNDYYSFYKNGMMNNIATT